jgi:hypothetical protein
MHVSLDSNVIIADRWLRSRHLEALLDYLDRTNSKLFLHEVVVAETKARIKQQFVKAINSIITATREAERIGVLGISMPEEHNLVTLSMLNWEATFDLWVESNAKVIELDNVLLPEITRRAVHRIPPFTPDGEEFRDAIIWLGLLRFVSQNCSVPEVAFISQNVKQFASPNKVDLDSVLLKDAEEAGIDVQYFSSLDTFIASRATPIAHVTREWIESHLGNRDLQALIHGYFRLSNPDFFVPTQSYEHRFQPVEVPALLDVTSSLVDFFIWQDKSGSLTLFMSFDVIATGVAECESVLSASARYETEQDPRWIELPCRAHRTLEVSADIEGVSITELSVDASEPVWGY